MPSSHKVRLVQIAALTRGARPIGGFRNLLLRGNDTRVRSANENVKCPILGRHEISLHLNIQRIDNRLFTRSMRLETKRPRREARSPPRHVASVSSRSKLDSYFPLEHARQIGLSTDLAEIGCGNVRTNVSETNIVEEVERIKPEPHP